MSLPSVDAGTEPDELDVVLVVLIVLVVLTARCTVVLVVAVFAVVVLDVATVLVVAVLDVTTVLVVEVATGTVIGTATLAGAAFQLAIVNEPQSLLSKLLIRPNSLWSIDTPQRALTDIQSPR